MARTFKVTTQDNKVHEISEELANFVASAGRRFRNLNELKQEAQSNPVRPKWNVGGRQQSVGVTA